MNNEAFRSEQGPGVLMDVADAVQTVRDYLDMDVAFVSEFVGDRRVFRYVDARQEGVPIVVGDAMPLEEGYCCSIVEGLLPQIIPNTADHPLCGSMSLTHRLPIGSHLGVPLRLPDGRLYGTFCCFNYQADVSLNERDLRLMHRFASMIARRIDADSRRAEDRDSKASGIQAALARGEPSIVYQPVFRLKDGKLLGAEALARFSGLPRRSPDIWFAEAAVAGLQIDLEVQAIRNAVAAYAEVWRHDGTMGLSVNASPETILSSRLHDALRGAPFGRITIEITEHERVEDYARLGVGLGDLRRKGCKIAVDDAGSGYASLRHILQIEPDVIKLDIGLTRGIDSSTGRRALAGGFIEFGQQTNCVIIAEGVETEAELTTLFNMRVDGAQGYLLGRPAPAVDLCARLTQAGMAAAPVVFTDQ